MKQTNETECVLYAFSWILEMEPNDVKDFLPEVPNRKSYLPEEFYGLLIINELLPVRVPLATTNTDYPDMMFLPDYWQELYVRNSSVLLVKNILTGGFHALAKNHLGIYNPSDGGVYDSIPVRYKIEEIIFINPKASKLTEGVWHKNEN